MGRHKRISIIGLGRLGLPLATVFADEGVGVIAFDKDEEKINLLKAGALPFHETDLGNYLTKNKIGMFFHSNREVALNDIVDNTDVTIVLVNTPSDKNNKSFSNAHIISVLTKLGNRLKQSDKEYHLIVLSSTVMPKTCSDELIP